MGQGVFSTIPRRCTQLFVLIPSWPLPLFCRFITPSQGFRRRVHPSFSRKLPGKFFMHIPLESVRTENVQFSAAQGGKKISDEEMIEIVFLKLFLAKDALIDQCLRLTFV